MLLDIKIGDKMELDSAISKKVEDLFKSELEDEKFELNYVIVDDSVTFSSLYLRGKNFQMMLLKKFQAFSTAALKESIL